MSYARTYGKTAAMDDPNIRQLAEAFNRTIQPDRVNIAYYMCSWDDLWPTQTLKFVAVPDVCS